MSETTSSKKVNSRLPFSGESIQSTVHTYVLGRQLGDGGYGTVFASLDKNDNYVAVKIEKYAKSMLNIELQVMKSAAKHNCKHFIEPIDYGAKSPEYTFLVMTLLNKDLHKLRNEQQQRIFTRSTAYRIGLQTIEAIRELHSIGYISRDVKPGNFAPGSRENGKHRTIFMFDFGLARKHKDKHGNVVPQRTDVGWRGTSRYGSLEAHRRNDLGRRDDVESWFYMLVEVTVGSLPWRLQSDRTKVYSAKLNARDVGRKQFLQNSPQVYDEFLQKVDVLVYASEPPYDFFLSSLKKLCKDHDYGLRDAYDWDDEDGSKSFEKNSYSDDENNKEMSDPNCQPTQDQ